MEQKVYKRIIKKENLYSKHLEEAKEILVSLPPGYDESRSYPLLVLHDGNDYFNLGRIVTQANQMMVNGEIEPVIMVAVPVQKERRTSEYSPKGSRHSQHMKMVVEELLPRIRDHYPTDDSPERLVLGGSSLGGTVSLHIALHYPEVSNRILSQSGAFLEATNEAILHAKSLEHFRIYQSVGKAETAVSTHMGSLDLVARNREVLRHLKEKHAHVHYVEDEGDHTWGFWQRDIPPALRFFFGR
ncbi:alpha/beta hydrolase [Paenactinomyces guangxiensis]|uniref:Esterase family protein n=1 Tax=Paenactinomyces guangxiensis TaxID=1490290 RepID=A0A7W1WRW0_9BACL|nr:alpha/beta hydrolase-fold protein [Paenactinomyces guangxiensis]MBA4494910.1 esterase family protein [Paenactinomyces guangxiensis]MBH8591993.1 esterase family protein [Paenactinomyces guangxiensis]